MDGTKIEWTDSTWNPLRGCSRVSEGCVNCYAERMAARFSDPGMPYHGLATTVKKVSKFPPYSVRSEPRWTGNVRLIEEALEQPLRWKRPRRVFVNSMSDLFHESVSNETVAIIFAIMAMAKEHTFQVLTKRPKRMKEWFEWAKNFKHGDGEEGPLGAIAYSICCYHGPLSEKRFPDNDTPLDVGSHWPLRNVWLGVSVENQKTADERIPLLIESPAAIRFVSYEPALGPVEFNYRCMDFLGDEGGLDWVIVGGESGPGARPFDINWARSAVDQCKGAKVPVFVKQMGARAFAASMREDRVATLDDPIKFKDKKGGDMSEWPEDLRVREFPR